MATDFVAAMGETFIKDTPVRRLGQPQDVAVAASFYCSPEAGFITGTILKVDGGYMLQSSMDQFVFSVC
ncbi:7-alpha-hydroxysteroid dehydrogenase [compost metagenome]